MKVCILTQTFPKFEGDGTAAFMRSLVDGLKILGCKVIVVTPFVQGLKPKSFPYKIFPYKYIWPSFLHSLGYSNTLKEGMKLKPSAYFLSPFLFFSAMIKLYRVCKEEKVDIVSAHWILPNGFIAACVCGLLGIPYIVSLPGSDVYMAKKNKLFVEMARFAANRAAAIVADSPQFMEELEKLGTRIKKKRIISYPVNLRELKSTSGYQDIRKSLGIKERDIILLAVGRLIEKKGFKYLIEALLKVNDSRIKLIIVGDGDLKQSLENLAFKTGLINNIFFVGAKNRKELINYYQLTDVFVNSSIQDSKGNIDDRPVSLIEAMAFAKPVIATNFSGIKLTVKNGQSGILVKEKNIEAFSNAIKKLATNRRLRQEMGAKGKEIIAADFTIEKIGEKYVSLFKEYIPIEKN